MNINESKLKSEKYKSLMQCWSGAFDDKLMPKDTRLTGYTV